PDAVTYIIENLPGLKRKYRDLELEYDFNMGRYHLSSNYTLAQAKGNIAYTQGLGTDFDLLPQHSVNRYGYLASDRRHRLKVYGWVDLPKKFEVAYDFFYGSGAPYNRAMSLTGMDAQGRNQYGSEFLDPRGSHRLPSTMTLDAEMRKHFEFGKDNRFTLLGSVHN